MKTIKSGKITGATIEKGDVVERELGINESNEIKYIKKEIRELADKLYFDLPFWKRREICKWYFKNNWDVTGEYEKCFKTARVMTREKIFWLRNFEI